MNTREQKLVVMFADVSGSAKLFGLLDDSAAGQAIAACLTQMRASLEAFHGRLIEIAGDELLAAFDTAESASLAAIDMQQRIADLTPISGLKPGIRIGLHLGPVSEVAGRLTGETLKTAARIAGLAAKQQILASSSLIAALPKDGQFSLKSALTSEYVRENGTPIDVFPVIWFTQAPPPEQQASASDQALAFPKNLSVRYRGKVLILDDKLPAISLGRDLENQFVIEDRKASRQHARIERRDDGYYLVDSSTNGSFVAFAGQQELMLRRQEMRLEGNGRICFGSSGNDPAADCAEFEYR